MVILKGVAMKKQVLVVTNEEDRPTNRVIEEIGRIGGKVARFNTESFPSRTIASQTLTNDENGGVIELAEGNEIRLNEITSCWYWRPIPAWVPEITHPGYAEFIQKESGAMLWSLYTTTRTFWMNHPLWSSKLLTHNKLLQMCVAKKVGLRVPETVIGNKPEDFVDLAKRHGGKIAAKPLKSGVFIREDDPTTLFLFTQILDVKTLTEKSNQIRICPFIGQEYIEKSLELRITVVGDSIFSCAIYSQDSHLTTVDWRRYDFEKVRHEKYALPTEIEKKLIALLKKLNLCYGAIDAIITPSGEFVFLEVNPAGQWEWIEELTGLQITKAMAEILVNPPASSEILY